MMLEEAERAAAHCPLPWGNSCAGAWGGTGVSSVEF